MRRPSSLVLTALTLSVGLIAACAKIKSAANHNDSVLQVRDTALTRHQKDSVVANSALPGAHAVGQAMKAQDSGAAHAAAIDSASAP